MKRYARYIHTGLLPQVRVKSVKPNEPVIVTNIPEPWQLIGRGNYAAVFVHPEVPDRVVKLYAPGRPGMEEEVEVYRRLGKHELYSECLYADREKRFLVLRRWFGKTLYECLLEGIPIPEQVIQDVDAALDYAKQRGLRPHDVHGKNVMMTEAGRGVVVDVSDFLEKGPSRMWHDLKRAYYQIYLPYMSKHPKQVPEILLNAVRKGYRIYLKGRSLWGSDS